MKLSIIITILNSHEIFRRQVLHWSKMKLPDDIEWLIIDDGSVPALQTDCKIPNFQIVPTNDFRPWTTSIARNFGEKLAKADFILMTDIDHILVQDTIMAGYNFTYHTKYDRMTFKRYFGVLDENGVFTQDEKVLLEWGLLPERIRDKGLRAPPHGNSFVMRKSIFETIGGYNTVDFGKRYPPMDETHFRGKYRKLEGAGKASTWPPECRSPIYLIPNGYYCGDVDYNPFSLFHNLSRSKWGFSKKFNEKFEKAMQLDKYKRVES